MPLDLRKRQVQAAARRHGLKLIVDRYSIRQTGHERYYVRPIWDARHAVRVLPGGGHDLVLVTRKRRHVASPLPLDDVELLLNRWCDYGLDRRQANLSQVRNAW
jgi:hypothetical protein